jgi:hypothetical protein
MSRAACLQTTCLSTPFILFRERAYLLAILRLLDATRQEIAR